MSNHILATVPTFGIEDPSVTTRLTKGDFILHKNPYGRVLSEVEITNLLQEYRPMGLLAGVEPLTKNVLQAASAYLKVISRLGTGWDNVDHATAKQLGIQVYRTPDAVTQAVAELTVGLFLDLARKISLQDRHLRKGLWKEEMGTLVHGKRLGIIGFGRIGRRVAELMKNMGCDVCGFDPYLETKEFERNGIQKKSELGKLASQSDLISLHLAYSPKMFHFIDEKFFNQCKPNLFLVNVSRGPIINEEHLIRALKNNKLAGVGLDVYEEEPYKGPLTNFDNVVLTPHIGSYARESWIRMEREAVDNLLRGLNQTRQET